MNETITVGNNPKYPLRGILSLPEDAGPGVPGVVLVQGSGPSDKDETIKANKPFRDIAESLTAKGIATLRYDKRTFVYGKQMVKEDACNITVREETMEDALAAAGFLRNDTRINPDRIYLLGHSMGGMLAPRIDAEGGNFAGLIILAGSPRTLREILVEQNQEILSQLKGIIKKLAEKQIAKLQQKLDEIPGMSEEEAKKAKVVGKTYAWYFKEMEQHPTAAYLTEIKKPVLILQGGKDFQVSPEKDFDLYRELCRGKANIGFQLYPGLNHLFMPSTHGKIKDYKKEYKIPSKVDQQVLDDIAAWITGN